MKKILAIMLCLLTLSSFSGCDENTTPNKDTTPNEETRNGDTGTNDVAQNEPEYVEKLFGCDVLKIEITVNADDWAYLMENATSKPMISCSFTVNGETFSNVGIKTKGNTSLTQIAMTDSERYSLKVDFGEYIPEQTCYGLDKLALNNIYADTTYLKEYMSYEIFQYMDVPSSLCTFAEIYVNGEYYGFFLALEDTDSSFIDRIYGADTKVEAYKPESMDMGGMNMPDGMDFTDFDILQFITIKDSEGNTVEISELNSAFDISTLSALTLKDGSVIDIANFDFTSIRDLDITEISKITDANGNEIDLNSYTVEMSFGMGGRGDRFDMNAENGGFGDMTGQGFENMTPPADMQMPDNTEIPTDMQRPENAGQPTDMQIPDSMTPPSGSSIPEMPSDTEIPQDFTPSGDMQMPDMSNLGGGFSMSGGGVDLAYIDDNLESYSNIFDNSETNTTEEDHNRLITSLKGISEGVNLEKYINVDEVLRYMACNVFIMNLDSYFASMPHNYILTEQDGVLSMVPWDYNLAFGTFQTSNSSDIINFAIDTVLVGVSAEDRPIIGKLMENEEYMETYREYLRQLVEEYILSGKFEETVNNTVEIIDEYIKNDTTTFYSYEEFTAGIEALKLYAKLRGESIKGQLDGTIPSTTEEQKDSGALVDSSALDLSLMGTMNMGGGKDFGNMDFGNRDFGNFDFGNMGFGNSDSESGDLNFGDMTGNTGFGNFGDQNRPSTGNTKPQN